MIVDLEAGVGTLSRARNGQIDILVVVAEPTVKSIEVAVRARDIAQMSGAKVILVGNRIVDQSDIDRLSAALGSELVLIPEDPSITAADRAGKAPIDFAVTSPGVTALVGLAALLA